MSEPRWERLRGSKITELENDIREKQAEMLEKSISNTLISIEESLRDEGLEKDAQVIQIIFDALFELNSMDDDDQGTSADTRFECISRTLLRSLRSAFRPEIETEVTNNE